ncbi:hypothetical protein ACFVJK_46840 [Streptomyces sp. NPDC127172]|uniref:hypothetical protein n=1 Tax=Streptomyces sp. NPDC127172 TaxID=3345382 RepID=UPI0036435768
MNTTTKTETKLTAAGRRALTLIATGHVVAQEPGPRQGPRIFVSHRTADRIRIDIFRTLLAAGLVTADETRTYRQGQTVSLTPAGRTALGVVPSAIKTTNTRAHRVRAIGRQHADDAAGMGECTVCDTVGEWNALVDLAPNAYGCSGRAAY